LTQLLYERVAGGNDDMKNNARVLARQPIDGVQNNTFGKACRGSNPQFTGRWVGKKLDFPDPLIEFIEGSDARLSSVRPYCVGSTPCVPRSNSGTPSVCSASASAREMAGWVMPSRVAAFAMLPVSATASSISS
jgi:hypothetical protein